MQSASNPDSRAVDARCVRLLTKVENAAAVAPVVETHALSRGDNDVLIEVGCLGPAEAGSQKQ